MAVKIPAQGTGDTTPSIATDKIAGIDYQQGKIVDGTIGSTNALIITAAGAAKVDGSAISQPITLIDGGDATLGTKADAAITDSTLSGTLMAFTKGIIKILADVWNSTLHALKVQQASRTATGTLTNNGDTLQIDVSDMGSLSIWQPGVAGGWDGTLLLEGSNDGGANWFDVKTFRFDDFTVINSFSNTTFVIRVNVAGFSLFHLKVTNRTAGNTTLTIAASPSTFPSIASAAITDGTNKVGVTNTGQMKVDASGTVVPIGDNSSHTVTVKPASTPPVATDTALVVTTRDAITTNPSHVSLTPAAPTFVLVGVASAQAVAANASRTGLILTNLSNNRIALGLGSAAVVNRGIVLAAGGVWEIDGFSFTTGVINAISTVANSRLSIQEFS